MATTGATQKGDTPPISDIQLEDGASAIFRSEASKKLLAMVQRVAPYPTAVLITGETGCGKEIVARGIHHFSLRHNQPLIDVNCAAIPEHLIESELFGYEKGAFSGADATKPGFFEMADGGSLFLDEVGELDARVQVKLLRVLDGASYYRLGGNKKVAVNVRIIAATNRNLGAEVEAGRFRRDLFHRLSQIQLHVPPLRDRLEDIEVLALHYLKQHKPLGTLSEDAIRSLKRYPWPGNIRELRNVIVNAAVMSDPDKDLITVKELPEQVRLARGSAPELETNAPIPTGDLEAMERRMILQALKDHNGDQGKAADQLGISRRTLTRKLKTYEEQAAGSYVAEPAFGRLATLQKQYFRANIDTMVAITVDSMEHKLPSVNVSAGGIGVKDFELEIGSDDEFGIHFPLPQSDVIIRGNGKVSWVDSQKRAGIRFQSLDNPEHLENWILKQLQKEGWEQARV